MTDLDLLHFEQLKSEIQTKYLENHVPSNENISHWKGIDIVYFQEDLRKFAKGNISEKSFYTYFKISPPAKLPRIDILNLLSIYTGYKSWYDFKKQHLFANEVLQDLTETDEEDEKQLEKLMDEIPLIEEDNTKPKKDKENVVEKPVLQISDTDNEEVKPKNKVFETYDTSEQNSRKKTLKNYVWGIITAILASTVAFLGFGNRFFDTTYTYCFSDADRNAPIQSDLEIKVMKQNESPLFYRIKPGECFYYPTKDTIINMVITSPFYENLEISRNLRNGSKEENIQLKPDDYKMAVFYFSKKDVSGNPDETMNLIKQKRRELENRISDNAVIYQVFDSDIYGIETLDKQKYINLVTLPTTSLKNLSVIEMKRDKGKIVSIKFKIKDENAK
ncbi:MAG: hypothetical protein Q4G16_03800 [Cruoricaptor ignavus]|nr:hypothetical protein [Cruoricaptor ignavus]